MQKSHLKHLVCPICKQDLTLSKIDTEQNERIQTGTLTCQRCKISYPVEGFIPRFVPRKNYATSFGLEWQRHARTQYDSYTGVPISETRFFEETKWSHDLNNELMLEVGSGSGRFTEIAIKTGALVISLDYSDAVEVNYASNGEHDNLLIVQGDIYHMPFREGYFDKLLCIGVIQHTPDVKGSFMALPPYLKQGGHLTVDVYRKPLGIKRLLATRYWIRPLTKRLSHNFLYSLCRLYVGLMWLPSRLIKHIPKLGRKINFVLLVPNYQYLGLSNQMAKEWAILDAFDILAPQYDTPQTRATLEAWFHEAGMSHIDVQYGYNGIEGRGVRAN